MRRFQPLPKTHPELSILEYPSFREYRVENWHLARDGSGRTINGVSLFTWPEAAAAAILSFLWSQVQGNAFASTALVMVSIFIWSKCTQVLFESVVVVPPHGIQLETHCGLPSVPLSTSRRFIPTVLLQDFIINEGLRGWDVRYYLIAIRKSSTGDYTSEVAYENILPHFPVLLEVYRGIHETLLVAESINAQIPT